jgi:LmbE family N-acetylglucosaminyl deacetylase
MDWMNKVLQAAGEEKCISFDFAPLPGKGEVAVLAPHPDDPDASAVLQRMLKEGGWEIRWLILTSGWSGVRDEFAGPDRQAKANCRRKEQLESARLFGIESVTFMDLPETEDGELADGYDLMVERLGDPDIVILPWGKDTNATHRLVYEWFMRWAEGKSVTAFFAEDPKSLDFTPHLEIVFDEETAAWKASLLKCHRSQTDRNLATRGITFSERILSMNRRETGFVERYRIMG